MALTPECLANAGWFYNIEDTNASMVCPIKPFALVINTRHGKQERFFIFINFQTLSNIT